MALMPPATVLDQLGSDGKNTPRALHCLRLKNIMVSTQRNWILLSLRVMLSIAICLASDVAIRTGLAEEPFEVRLRKAVEDQLKKNEISENEQKEVAAN